jgi:phosphotransferase system enzyme I (PtsP)
MVGDHMKADVCSIYLYDDTEKLLTLKATKGLNQDSVNHVTLRLGEGITGQALDQLNPICLTEASKHPNYKGFSGLEEEPFESFLAVPILRGIEKIGALVLQRKNEVHFDEGEILTCRAVASQLANMIENARFLIAFHDTGDAVNVLPADKNKKRPVSETMFIKGQSASKGYALAPCRSYNNRRSFNDLLKRDYEEVFTSDDLKSAINKTSRQLEQMQTAVDEKLDDAASLIFSSHLLLLKDRVFISKIEEQINNGTNAPTALLNVAKGYIEKFSAAQNVFVREKANDMEDITVRIMANLLDETEDIVSSHKNIVIARDLFPSELLKLTSENVSGVILVSGGATSHLSILARSLQMPMVIANKAELLELQEGTEVLLDAETGYIHINPTRDVISEVEKREQQTLALKESLHKTREKTITADGTTVHLYANINLLSDLKLANEMKAEGIGLYRTEFPFIVRNDFPTEEEQYIIYKKLMDGMKDKPVIFRTLDVGGDKMLSYYHDVIEQNPAIGLRSIRFSLQKKDVFYQQIRAMLRAGFGRDLGIMFPMISSLDEFDQAREVVEECKSSLEREGYEFNANPNIGIMIELPSVVEIMEDFASEADFFSIGTNDFVQFMLGVDRTNENVADFYLPHHPSVLRALNKVVWTANKYDKPIGICGSMAGDIRFIPFLLGIGMRRLSLDPSYLPAVQDNIEKIDMGSAERFTEKLLTLGRASQVEKMLANYAKELA